MVFQAFVDDSTGPDITVLAGHLATVEQWAALSSEWDRLLPGFGTQKKNGRYHFKMAEMAITPERMGRVAAFYRVIEAHVGFSVSVWLRHSDIAKAFQRITKSDPGLRNAVRPFDILVMAMMSMVANQQPEIAKRVPLELPIDFYFDDQTEKRALLEMWDDAVAAQNEDFRRAIVKVPKFEDDTVFLPLQAADFWAWWVRKWHSDGTPEQLNHPNFGRFAAKRENHLKLDLRVTEGHMAALFATILRRRSAG